MNYRDAVLRSRPFLYVPSGYGATSTVAEVVGRRTCDAFNAVANGPGMVGDLRSPEITTNTAGTGIKVSSDTAINDALLNTFSFSTWVAYTTSGSLMRLCGKASGSFLFAVLVNYRSGVGVTAGWVSIYSRTDADAQTLSFDAGASFYDGSPHRLTFVRDGTTDMRAYVDGRFVASGTPVTAVGSNTNDLVTFGQDGTDSARFLGRSAHFTLWDRPLSHAEDREMYNAGRGMWSPNAPRQRRR